MHNSEVLESIYTKMPEYHYHWQESSSILKGLLEIFNEAVVEIPFSCWPDAQARLYN